MCCKENYMSVATVWSVKIGRIAASTSLQIESWMELDTHADTTVLGKSCLVIQDFNKTMSVLGWDASVGSTECPTVSGVVAYDHPYTGITYMLVCRQFIWIQWKTISSAQCRVELVECRSMIRQRFSCNTPLIKHMLLWSRTQ